jgi:uncharacterized paraquat-inducible protein A
MSTGFVLLVCVIACPVVMLLMMLFMRRGHGHAESSAPATRGKSDDDRTGG